MHPRGNRRRGKQAGEPGHPTAAVPPRSSANTPSATKCAHSAAIAAPQASSTRRRPSLRAAAARPETTSRRRPTAEIENPRRRQDKHRCPGAARPNTRFSSWRRLRLPALRAARADGSSAPHPRASPACLLEPSDGLEPSTPPYHEREEGADRRGFAWDDACVDCSGVAGHGRVSQTRATLVRPRPTLFQLDS